MSTREFGKQSVEPRAIEALRAVACADQHRATRGGQLADRREMRTTGREPFVVDRIQRAEAVDHVRAAHGIVGGCDDDVECGAVDARIEDLHGKRAPAAPRTEQADQQRGATAAADREVGPGRCEEVRWVADRRPRPERPSRRQRIPRLAQAQAHDARIEAERPGKGQCLALVAGGAIADHPRRRCH